MNYLISNILETSMYSCLIVVVVLILRFCLKKASRSAICMLWLLVGLRLLIIFPIESKFAVIPDISSVFSDLDRPDDVPGADVYKAEKTAGISSDDIIRDKDAINNLMQYLDEKEAEAKSDDHHEGSRYQAKDIMQYAGEAEYEDLHESTIKNDYEGTDGSDYAGEECASLGLMPLLGIIWIAGVLFMWLYAIRSNLKIKKQLSTAVKDSSNEEVFYTEFTDSAFVFGIRKPKIYVGFVVEEKDRDYILAHEREHIRRKDHLIKLTGYILLSLYWFAPWIWAAFLLLCKDMELACDEGVISSMEPVQRADYAGTLFKIGTGRLSAASGMIHFGEVSIRERIKTIMNYKKKAAGITGILIVVLVVCIMVLIPVQTSEATDKPENTYDTGELTVASNSTDSPAGENRESENPVEELTGNESMIYKYLDIKDGGIIISKDAAVINRLDIMYLRNVFADDEPLYIRVDEDNAVYDSRNGCNAIIETATGRLVFGCSNTEIPDSVTEISEMAFADCTRLTEINIPDNISKIGIGAFRSCNLLASVSLPENLTSIDDYAFAYCGRLSEINLTERVIGNGLGEGAFLGCYSLPKEIMRVLKIKCPQAYPLNRAGDDLSNVEYHFREEAPEQSDYQGGYYYAVPDFLDRDGNLSLRIAECTEDGTGFVYTGETKTVRLADNCSIIVRGRTEKSGNKLRYITADDLRYICDYYMVATDKNNIEEIVMHEYVYPFICVEADGEITDLRESDGFEAYAGTVPAKTAADDDDYTDEYNYNSDVYHYDSVIDACYVACANEKANAETSEEIILQAGDGVNASREWTISGGKDGHENFEEWMDTALGKGWQERFGVCAVNSVGVNSSQEYDTDHCVYTITVKNGRVYRTWAPAWKGDKISRIYP